MKTKSLIILLCLIYGTAWGEMCGEGEHKFKQIGKTEYFDNYSLFKQLKSLESRLTKLENLTKEKEHEVWQRQDKNSYITTDAFIVKHK